MNFLFLLHSKSLSLSIIVKVKINGQHYDMDRMAVVSLL